MPADGFVGQLQATHRRLGLLLAEVGAQFGQTGDHGVVGGLEGVVAVAGEEEVDAAAVFRVLPALDVVTSDESVDERRNRGTAHGEELCEVGVGGSAVVEKGEQAVLGETEVGFGQSDRDEAGQSGRRPGGHDAPGMWVRSHRPRVLKPVGPVPTGETGHGSGRAPWGPGLGFLLPGLMAVVLLLAVNAFFVAAEFSLVAVDRARSEASAAAGHRGDTRIRGLLRRLTPTMSGCQFGITVAALLLGFVAEPIMARLLTGEAHATGLSVGAAIGAATGLHLVFGEQVPKYVALATPEATIRSLASPLAAYSAATRPLITGLNRFANAVARGLGVETRDQISTSRTRDELEDLIRQSGAEGSLEQEEADLLWRSIRFGEKTASDILIPRVDVKSLQRHDTATTLARLSQATGFSRFPVVGEDLDDVLGVVHVKVVYGVPADERPTTPVEALMRDVPFVPEMQPLDDLFADLRSGRGQMAMIVDEHGGTAGIVTMEDLLEELVGAIDDEHDRSLPRTNVEDTDSKIVSGRLNLDQVLEATGFEVPEGPYETLAGYVLDRLGHLPQPSEMVEEDGWRVEVVAVFGRRIETLRVVALEEPEATSGEHTS